MGPVCIPGSVTVPCEQSAWDFGAQALYLKASYPGFSYDGSTTAGTTETFHKIPYDWGWGFMVEGSYHFSTGSDFNLNWYHYDKTTSGGLSGVIFTDRRSVSFDGSISGTIKPKWDAVNFEFGQHVDYGNFKNIRFHGGVQYARIETAFHLTAVDGTFVGTTNTTMKYNGFGPRVGADMSYDWNNGVSIYAKTATALLVGTHSLYTTERTAPTIITGSASGTIVPELEAKLGATYTRTVAHGDLSLDVGWMWLNYFSAQQEGLAGGLTHESNFGLQGLYLGLKWLGNIV